MPNTKSATKALRQSARRRKQNLSRKATLKKATKEFKKAVTDRNKEQATTALSSLYKTADKVAKTDYIKKNRAGRIKSRATAQFKKTFKEA